MGLHPGPPGSCLEPGADAQLLSHPGVQKMVHSDLVLNSSPGEEESLNPLDKKITSQLISKIHNLLALVGRETTTCQVIFKNCIFVGGERNIKIEQNRRGNLKPQRVKLWEKKMEDKI